MWTQVAKWYLGSWKGGNDPLYLAYPTKNTPLSVGNSMTNDFNHIGAFAGSDLLSCLMKDLLSYAWWVPTDFKGIEGFKCSPHGCVFRVPA